MKRILRLLPLSLIALGLVFYFENCAQPLPDSARNFNQSSNSAANLSTVAVSANPASTIVGTASQLLVSGGEPPYTFSVLSGTASIGNTGAVTSSTAGAVLIAVTDVAGETAQVAISFVSATTSTPSSPSAASCTTSWGAVIPSGSQIIGFKASSAECPASCQSETLTCTNGTLSGGSFTATAGSCSVAACVYKQTIINYCNYTGDGSVLAEPAVASVPPTCPASEVGQSVCVLVSLGGDGGFSQNQYECVSPSTVVTPTNPTAGP